MEEINSCGMFPRQQVAENLSQPTPLVLNWCPVYHDSYAGMVETQGHIHAFSKQDFVLAIRKGRHSPA